MIMTTKQLKKARSVSMSIIGIMLIILFTAILRNLPGYLEGCRMLTTTAKVARVIAFFPFLCGIMSCAFNDEEDEPFGFIYFPIAITAFYEIVFFYYYFRVRIIGYHRFISYSDCLGVLLVTLAMFLIIVFYLIYNIKLRRFLFDNKTWRDEFDNNVLIVLSKYGVLFSLSFIVMVFVVEGVHQHMFKPSGVDNGYPYVDLKLPSDTKWATKNFFSNGIDDLGVGLRWGQTTNQTIANQENYQGVDPLAFLADSEDAVSELMGGDWYIPTQADWEELLGECKIRPAFYKGVYGIVFNGPKFFKRLFIPAAELDISWYSSYWTSTVIPIPDEDEVESNYEYLYEDEVECDTCSCNDCNCCCRIVEDEIFEDDDLIESFYIEAAIVKIPSIEFLTSKRVFFDQAYSCEKCYIRPVSFKF